MSRSSLLARIPAGDRLLLDTTVLAAYLDATDVTHPVAVCVLKDLVESGRNPAVVPLVTVMEILVRPLRQSPPGHRTVLAFLRSHANLEAVPVDLQVAQEAAIPTGDAQACPAGRADRRHGYRGAGWPPRDQ